MSKKKPIDRVTIDRLEMCLNMCDIDIPIQTIDKIIDLVELIEDKGGNTSLRDISKLKSEWA